MKKLEDIQNIVNASIEGWSDSKIAKEFHMSRNTVRKYRKRYWEAIEKIESSDNKEADKEELEKMLNSAPAYDSSNRKPYKYSREIDTLLDTILHEEEERVVREGDKYRPLSKTKIHQRVKEAGFKIGYTTISKKIDEKRLARSNISPWKEMIIKVK